MPFGRHTRRTQGLKRVSEQAGENAKESAFRFGIFVNDRGHMDHMGSVVFVTAGIGEALMVSCAAIFAESVHAYQSNAVRLTAVTENGLVGGHNHILRGFLR